MYELMIMTHLSHLNSIWDVFVLSTKNETWPLYMSRSKLSGRKEEREWWFIDITYDEWQPALDMEQMVSSV